MDVVADFVVGYDDFVVTVAGAAEAAAVFALFLYLQLKLCWFLQMDQNLVRRLPNY